MKIAVTSRCVLKLHGYGGMERYVYYFTKNLAKNGIEVTLITSNSKKRVQFNFRTIAINPNVNESNKFIRPILYRIFLRNVSKYLQKKTLMLFIRSV